MPGLRAGAAAACALVLLAVLCLLPRAVAQSIPGVHGVGTCRRVWGWVSAAGCGGLTPRHLLLPLRCRCWAEGGALLHVSTTCLHATWDAVGDFEGGGYGRREAPPRTSRPCSGSMGCGYQGFLRPEAGWAASAAASVVRAVH
jgi:hypothetical protein